MTKTSQRPILIAGPTASGKSALALAIARRLGGVVINADSMQVYRELAILTARPSPEDEAIAPHRLYGHVAGVDGYSAAQFAAEAGREVRAAQADGLVPIIVGGTGLYFMALTEGLSPVPEIPADVRAYWRGEAQRIGAEDLHRQLAKADPGAAARLNPGDTQRVTRALEVFAATGRSLIAWQAVPGTPIVQPAEALQLVLQPDRAALQARCDRRFDAMIEAGALEEVQRFLKLDIPADRPIWGALGVRALSLSLTGECSLASAIERAKMETRQFSKRQMTWLKRRMISWNVVHLEYLERNLYFSDSFIDKLIDDA